LQPAEAELRGTIAAGLRERREEIERSIATRVYAISEPPELVDPAYLEGLRASFTAAVEFALAVLELGERRAPDVPAILLAQARMAARGGVGLDTVLRRYAAGYSLFLDLVVAEFEQASPIPGSALRGVLQGQGAVFDRLFESVSEEYRRESARPLRSPRTRLAERVRRLLSGESIDAADLDYDLGGFHLGAAGTASEVEPAIRALASELDLRVLCVPAEEGRLWAWLSSARSAEALVRHRIDEPAERLLPSGAVLAFGEPGEGTHGWRLTHRQALAALPMAGSQEGRVVHYAEVSLLAAISKDELLRESLQRVYLSPLDEEQDGGEELRRTLMAYFAADRNITSAGAALGLNRQTVASRLRNFEQRLGRSLTECGAELETALRSQALGSSRTGPSR
jgi:hypothetical protein